MSDVAIYAERSVGTSVQLHNGALGNVTYSKHSASPGRALHNSVILSKLPRGWPHKSTNGYVAVSLSRPKRGKTLLFSTSCTASVLWTFLSARTSAGTLPPPRCWEGVNPRRVNGLGRSAHHFSTPKLAVLVNFHRPYISRPVRLLRLFLYRIWG